MPEHESPTSHQDSNVVSISATVDAYFRAAPAAPAHDLDNGTRPAMSEVDTPSWATLHQLREAELTQEANDARAAFANLDSENRNAAFFAARSRLLGATAALWLHASDNPAPEGETEATILQFRPPNS